MSPRVRKGVAWFKQAALYCGIFFVISLFFAFGSENTLNKVAAAGAGLISGILVFGAIAFVAGWIWGSRESSPSGKPSTGA